MTSISGERSIRRIDIMMTCWMRLMSLVRRVIKRSRTEPVDVEERELLYLAEKAGAQIGSETNGCMGRYVDIGNAKNQSDNGDQYHLSAHGSDDGEVSLHHSVVYNIRHVHRLNGFAHHRHEYQQRACQQAYFCTSSVFASIFFIYPVLSR